MALTIGDNFSYQGAKPLDGRIKYDTLAAMKAMADSTLYDGCLAYCVATDKTYQWKSTNTVDPDTGKWREFTSGGGTGGGHTIEDPEGTALTQRDTLQFGGDLEVSDDDENEKTVVAPHELTTEELTEIMSTLPGQPTRGITIDLRGNEQVVGKVIESDGTEKTLYQKIITGTFPTVTTEAVEATNEIALNISNIDTVYAADGIAYITPWNVTQILNNAWGSANYVSFARFQILSNTTLQIVTNRVALSGLTVYVTLQYTKTTS